MSDNLQQFRYLAEGLMRRDYDLKAVVMPAMDALGDNNWTRPTKELQDMTWLVDRIDSSPRNAEIAGVRAYSTMWPNLSIVRPGSDEADKERSSKVEDLLGYQFMRASSRPNMDMWAFGSSPTDKILRSALRYGEIAAQVVHVDAQLGLMGNVKANRKRAIKQHGDYVINVHNPQNVHVRASGLTLEGVLLKKTYTLSEFIAFWGDKAKPLMAKYEGDESKRDETYVCSYDWTDFDVRAVWAHITSSAPTYKTYQEGLGGEEILYEEHDLPFLPWSWRGGVEPLNYAVYKTGAWDAANVAETFSYSENIHYQSAPRYQKKGPNPDSIIIDFTTPGNPASVPPSHELLDMSPPQINEAHMMASDRARGDIKAMTVPSVVTSLESSSNEAYATFDQRLKSGLSAYEPQRQIAERVHEDIFCHMLYWSKYLDKPLSGPYVNRKRSGEVSSLSYGSNGEPFEVKPSELSYDAKVTVSLMAGQTLDDQQKITAATQATQYLGWSQGRANEYIGENDPEKLEEEKVQEVLRQTALQNDLLKQQAEATYESELIVSGLKAVIPYIKDPNFGPQIVQMLQQAVGQMEMQQQQQAQAAQGEGAPANPENTQGMPMVEGDGFNPANGGQPAAMANPAANTRQNQTGRNNRQ